jgi:Tetracyclin repressor-like, C-terminal domain
MESTKKTAPRKKIIDDDFIISKYMEYVLEKNEEPKNVFLFCKEYKIDETDFYTFFGNISAIKQEVWYKFFQNVKTTIDADVAYQTYSDKNKLLTIYFTVFEILTLNRSYVLYDLEENKNGLKNVMRLKTFRKHFKKEIESIIDNKSSELYKRISKITKPVFVEGAWIQFLFLLKFWIDDTSKGLEKTDVLIEKSVNTIVDLLDTKPLENLLDLGKFLWKERTN